jgi:hypothetical protein
MHETFLRCGACGIQRIPLKATYPSRYQQQVAIKLAYGFLSMFASFGCMHCEWKNYPVIWEGDYGDREGKQSIVLELVANKGLHIWHIVCGHPCSNNDLTVLI